MLNLMTVLITAVLFISGCGWGDKKMNDEQVVPQMVGEQFELTAPAFENKGSIPRMYTCDDDNVSPELRWTNAPKGTESFALICEDPDAPGRTFIHWILYNIPGTKNSLPEALVHAHPEKRDMFATLSDGSIHGLNDFELRTYGGPCPPSGTHRYFFKLYALDTKLSLKGDIKKEDLLKAMEGHILGTAELMGTYQRS